LKFYLKSTNNFNSICYNKTTYFSKVQNLHQINKFHYQNNNDNYISQNSNNIKNNNYSNKRDNESKTDKNKSLELEKKKVSFKQIFLYLKPYISKIKPLIFYSIGLTILSKASISMVKFFTFNIFIIISNKL